MASVTEKLNLFYLILFNLNLKSHVLIIISRVKTSENHLLHKSNENMGKNGPSQLFKNPGN